VSIVESFTTPVEDALSQEFVRQGYVIRDVQHPAALNDLRHQVVVSACEYLGIAVPENEAKFLNRIHDVVSVQQLNDLRLAIYARMNAYPWFRPTYFALAKSVTEVLVGNELAMQNRINLSLQMPRDDSSLLEIHSDALSGETPFQVVQWLPLVDVYDTKAMFILPPEINREVYPGLKRLHEEGGTAGVFRQVRDHVVWLNIPYGKVLIFTPNLLHGNVVNEVPETRWSLNCRFTGLFTPYASSEKSLGGFYLPITTRIVSRVGMSYRPPEGFDE
jgi:sporadic carbohydrate cluster 2OG-Fe(II) oxygenase